MKLSFGITKSNGISWIVMGRIAPEAGIVLVSSRGDLSDNLVVYDLLGVYLCRSLGDGKKQSRDWGVEFASVSSKTGNGVEDLFKLVGSM
jgi:hypothetical protein